MAKLTLSVDDKVIAAAKRYASAHDTSVSKMVENYLRLYTKKYEIEELGPVTASLLGIAKGADPEDYKRHLIEKYK
jgi:hypothetical protein